MHGLLFRSTKPPWSISLSWESTQRLQKPRHICPSNLQTFQNPTVANITPEHHMQRNVLRMPWHHLTRPHILRNLNCSPTNIVFNFQVSIRTHLTHGTRKNQRYAPINTIKPPVLISAVNSLTYTTIRIIQISIRSPS